MTDGERRSTTIATVVTLAILAVALLALTSTAIATPDSYTVEQGEQCHDVEPIGNGTQSVEEFYDYRSNETDQEGEFSSYGTREYQRDNTSTMLLYNGSEGTSLVFVHEKLHDSAEDGTNGSSITFDVSGIEPGDSWAVEDDDYTNRDDTFEHYDTHSEIDWVWGQGRTDGGAYRGLGNDTDIQIDPAFNEDADERYNSYQYTGWVHDWEVAEGTSDDERTALNSLEESVTVQSGYCADAPTATLDVNDSTPPTVVGETVTLDAGGSDADAEIDRYEWDFNSNGTVDETTNESQINHEFDTAGTHNVTVTVVDIHGQTGSETRSVEVGNETPPSASLDAPDTGTIRENLTFDGSESRDGLGIETYEWNFGDGMTIADGNETETHAYDAPGNYTVELTTVDSAGNTDTSTATVVVDPIPPTAALNAPESSAAGDTVTLDASSSDAGPNASYEWVIDGTSVNTTETPTYNHTFTGNGSYSVQVNVSDEYGHDTADTTIEVTEATTPSEPTAALDEVEDATAGSTVNFDASASDGDVVSYDWNFGDGNATETESSSTSYVYDEPGTYTVELTVVDDNGNTDTTSTTVEVVESSEPPVARLDAPESSAVGDTVTLDASGSNADSGASYEWMIDGTTVNTTDSPTYDHTFTSNGSYSVQVNVSDADGYDTADTTIEATEATTPSEPTAALDNVEETTAGSKVHFDASASDGDVVTYNWDFGDGNTAETKSNSNSHVYDAPGTYTVELTVVNDDGNTDTTSTTLTIVKSPEPPVARLDAPDSVVPGKIVTLNASASDVGPDATYEWIVDGESVKTTDSPTYDHTFTGNEIYHVQVNVSDEYGHDTAETTVEISGSSDSPEPEPPTARLDIPDDPTEGMLTMNASRSEVGDNATFDWFLNGDHKDEDYADDPAIFKTGFSASEHHVRVQVTDDGGSDNATATITVDPAVEAALDVPDDAIVGETVTLDASGSAVDGTASYEWIIDGTPENTTTKPTYNYTVSETREYDVRVNVTNDDGRNDAAEAAITVEEETDDSDDGSDNSGGSGGYAPQPAPSEPVETSAEMVNGTLIVTAEGGIEAGEPFDVDLSTEDSMAPDEIDSSSVEVTPAEDAETMTIEFRPAARDVPGRFAESSAIAANASHDIESVAYEFAIGTDILDAAGVTPSTLTAYTSADGDEWTAIETDTEDDGDYVVVSGSVDGDDALGIGATGSALFVSNVTTNGVTTDGTVDLKATVRNTGTEQGEATVPIEIGDDVPVSESITLDADEERVIETTVPLAASTDDTVRVGGVRTELAVVTVADLTVPSTPAPNEPATVEATLVNHGSATGEFDTELVVDGAVATTETVAIEPGEQTTVAFDHQFGAANTYEIAVGNATKSIDVAERDNFDDNDDEENEEEGTSDPTSGFGVLAALCAVIGALGVLGHKRLRR